jgi:hypothetical protein
VTRRLHQQRQRWAKQYDRADAATRRRLAREATRGWMRVFTEEVLPRWEGTPWGRGKDSTARVPGDPEQAVNCASFVVAALEGADFRFAHRQQLAAAPALRLLEAVSADGAIARLRDTMAGLARHLRTRGAGVYLVGLPKHVAFAVVTDGEVRLIHASQTAGRVVSEPLATSLALGSAGLGELFVAPLAAAGESGAASRQGARDQAASDALVTRWLVGAPMGPQ